MKQIFIDIILKAILAATTNTFIAHIQNQRQYNEILYFRGLDLSRKKICSVSRGMITVTKTDPVTPD